jgi:solute carrier family 25 iron transporter 28/37
LIQFNLDPHHITADDTTQYKKKIHENKMDSATPDKNTTTMNAATNNDVASSSSSSAAFDEEWEEWDGNSPFWVHCVAGSLAGVAEHVLVYPLDTVRTHLQVCAACHYNPATHNASTQAATMAAKGGAAANASSSVPGSILQQAASSASPIVSKTISKQKNKKMVATVAASSARGGTGVILGGAGSGSGNHNMSMLQAIRQLVSQQQPLALETTAGAATTTTEALKNAAASVTNTTESQMGATRLWRGVQTILVGCIPAHAMYFSTYEIVKAATLDDHGEVTAYGSALAGGAAVVTHDIILGPLDTVKQRMQLGYYNGLTDALTQMIRNEGAISLLRSFPITLATNIPYGMIMVGTNEVLKDQWTKTTTHSDNGNDHHEHSELTLGVTLGASSVAGLVAAATTTPLDRIKTYLQTQQLAPSCLLNNTQVQHCPYGGRSSAPIVANWKQAALRIYEQEGTAGFFRGLTPRILSHTPAVAISWTTYETFKRYLKQHFCEE